MDEPVLLYRRITLFVPGKNPTVEPRESQPVPAAYTCMMIQVASIELYKCHGGGCRRKEMLNRIESFEYINITNLKYSLPYAHRRPSRLGYEADCVVTQCVYSGASSLETGVWRREHS